MRKLKLLSLLVVTVLFSSCTGGTPGVNDVIEEPTGQAFNTLDKYIAYEIVTSSGEKQDAAVIATIEIGGSDKKIENEARNAARPADREEYDAFLEKHAGKEMIWVKSLVRIMPVNGSDFSNCDALLTCFAGIDSDTEERPFANIKLEPDSLMTTISQFYTYTFDSGDAIKSASMFTFKNETDMPFYESVVYSIMPANMEHFTLAFTSKKFNMFESGIPDTFPAEGYLCWEIPTEKD